ncbi:hypothetical protein C8R44DRAFT_883012 [Mycena epipterygia]|nr:hypothetical protein C8R44DRAFT_883012 [Mycena epipterygia]
MRRFPPDHTQFYVLWDFFIPAFTYPFPMYSVGTLADGGKWVCGLERDVLERSPGCLVYAFDSNSTEADARKWPWGETNDGIDGKLTSRVHFNHFSVADLTAKHHRSLESVMGQFGHDFVDILKIDLEGSEFATLVSIISDAQHQENPELL